MAMLNNPDINSHSLPWVDYDQANKIMGTLSDLLTYPKQRRMPCLFISGPESNGKSALISRFSEVYPPRAGRNQPPLLCCELPERPTESKFYDCVLSAMCPSMKLPRSASEKEYMVRSMLDSTGVEMLFIDAFERILTARPLDRRVLLNVLKVVINLTEVIVVAVGRPDSADFLFENDEMCSRFHPVELPLWEEGDAYVRLFADLERASAAQSGKQPFTNDPLVAASLRSRVLQITGGRIGEISRLVSLGGDLLDFLEGN